MIRRLLRHSNLVRNVYALYILFVRQFSLSHFKNILWFWSDYRYLRRAGNNHFEQYRLMPCLNDKTDHTPMDPVYFYQDTWAAKKIFDLRPAQHVDVGSSAKTIGILSQFVPITMIDIRPLPLKLDGLNFIKGSILDLPYGDNAIPSISCLCVIEHIGLGRYGDPLDAYGSEKAVMEVRRVTAPGGTILFSVPVDTENRVYFNAHRAFTREYVLSLFADCELLEERYQYGYELHDSYSVDRGFGTGLYLFRKRRELAK